MKTKNPRFLLMSVCAVASPRVFRMTPHFLRAGFLLQSAVDLLALAWGQLVAIWWFRFSVRQTAEYT